MSLTKLVNVLTRPVAIYGERLLDGGFTEGLPMKLEVASIPPGLLWCGIWRNTWAGVVRIRS